MIKKKIVTIVGAGVIGAGWAARMLACGLIVNAYDPSVKARKQLLSNTKTALKSLQRLGLNKNAKLSNLKIYSDLRESLHSTTFVQENAPENEKLKKKLLKDIDKLLPKNIIIASSSSGLLPTRIQSLCNYPERVCIGHPFNPVYLLPLVELVSGKQTKKNTIIKDGIAASQDVDDAIVYGPGLRWSFMGVCLTFHLAGGQTGMKHMLEQFGPALKLPRTKLKAPKLDAKLKKLMISGTKKQAGKYSIKDLEVRRDIFLIEIMKTLNKYQRNNFPNWNKTFNKF